VLTAAENPGASCSPRTRFYCGSGRIMMYPDHAMDKDGLSNLLLMEGNGVGWVILTNMKDGWKKSNFWSGLGECSSRSMKTDVAHCLNSRFWLITW
jgi:hypothetical protein